MKKAISKHLNELAEKLPIGYDVEPVTIQLTGYELNRSGYGETRKFKDTYLYEIPFFQLRAVEHKQQLKDAYKRDGINGFNKYMDSLIQKI